MQNMGPIEDLARLSFESQLLINVSGRSDASVAAFLHNPAISQCVVDWAVLHSIT